MTRRAHRPQRIPIFVGCEGESEASYVSLLGMLAEEAGLAVAIKAENLAPGAGDPLARVERAVERLNHYRTRRVDYRHRFLLLDDDQLGEAPDRAARARRLAAEHDLTLIWQTSCHEAFLLRHMAGRANNRPPDSAAALRALLREWPQYRKAMDRMALASQIDLPAIRRAAAVEPQLAELLRVIGLLR